jgi:hypothetical protein
MKIGERLERRFEKTSIYSELHFAFLKSAFVDHRIIQKTGHSPSDCIKPTAARHEQASVPALGGRTQIK